MAWSDLDTRAWNLGTLALGVGACGPLVPVSSDTDGDETPDDDETSPDDTATVPPTASDTVGPGCGAGPACPPGYVCEDGRCVYEYYCQSCCIGECGGYTDCFEHDDCGDNEYCGYYTCNFLPYLYDCGSRIAFALELIADVPGTSSMTFADTNGDGFDDLAQLAESTAWVFRGPDSAEAVPIDLFGGSLGGAIVGTNIDGVGATELTVSSFEADLLLTLDVVSDPVPLAIAEPALAAPVVGDFDGDGFDDIAGQAGTTMALFSNGMQFGLGSDFGDAFPLPLAVGDLGPAPGDEVAFADGWVVVAELLPDGASLTMLEELYRTPTRTPVVGDFDGDGSDDVLAIGQRAGGLTSMLAVWSQPAPGSFSRVPYYAVPALQPTVDGYFAAAVGDFDGDGADDVVVAGINALTVLFGTPGGGGSFSCLQTIPVPALVRFVAAGDHDANGRDDIAWSDGIGLTRILLVQ